MQINTKRRPPEETPRHGWFAQLLANGYQPLPNENKVCRRKGWGKINIDETQARRWDRSTRWPAIGLRVRPPLLVVDCDVPDESLMRSVREMLPPAVLDGLERIGRPPKAAFFLRYETTDGELLPFRRRWSRRFTRDPDDKDADTFQIEIFGGGGGAAQIGAFGPHSLHPDGSVALEYAWVGDSPLERRLDTLPVIGRKETFAIIDGAEAIFAAAGLKVAAGTRRSKADKPPPLYDLTPETVFEAGFRDGIIEVDRKGLAKLVREAKASGGPRVRVTGSFTGDPNSNGSLRGLVSIGRSGVTIVDTKDWVTHKPVEADPNMPLSDEFAAELEAIFAAFGGEL
jgi:hypothetical protein